MARAQGKESEQPGRSHVKSAGELRPHLVDDLSRRRHHPDNDEFSAIDDGLAIHEDFVFTVAAPDRFHIDPELPAEARRHTGGMQSRHSERAIANRYPGHIILLAVQPATRDAVPLPPLLYMQAGTNVSSA